jgi:hypothetical protein
MNSLRVDGKKSGWLLSMPLINFIPENYKTVKHPELKIVTSY